MSQNTENKLTPKQAVQVLLEVVSHPGVRCFNLQELQTALAAIQTLKELTNTPPELSVVSDEKTPS